MFYFTKRGDNMTSVKLDKFRKFENISKRDMTQEEWDEVKSNIKNYFI